MKGMGGRVAGNLSLGGPGAAGASPGGGPAPPGGVGGVAGLNLGMVGGQQMTSAEINLAEHNHPMTTASSGMTGPGGMGPRGKMARLSRLAMSVRGNVLEMRRGQQQRQQARGLGMGGERGSEGNLGVFQHQRLSGQSSGESGAAQDAAFCRESTPEDPRVGFDGDGGGLRGSKRDKFSKGRSPMQCLNPMQLQPPASVSKAADVKAAAEAATAASGLDLELGRTTGTKVVVEDADEGKKNKKSVGSEDSVGGGSRGKVLQRTFRVDLNEDDQPRPPEAETTPLLQPEQPHLHPPPSAPPPDEPEDDRWRLSGSGGGGGGGGGGDGGGGGGSTNVLLGASSNSSSEDRSAPMLGTTTSGSGVGGRGAASGGRGGGDPPRAASATSSGLPGLKPSRNNSSGWL